MERKASIILDIHARPGGSKNNALYVPKETETDAAKIMIGNGDGNILKNLPQDREVISHELGHHIIYHHITQTSGESLILHEGLADFFTF